MNANRLCVWRNIIDNCFSFAARLGTIAKIEICHCETFFVEAIFAKDLRNRDRLVASLLAMTVIGIFEITFRYFNLIL